MKIDYFVVAILIAVGLAYLFPQPAEILPLDLITGYGISLIFFFYGLKLSPKRIQEGLGNWKLHVLIQVFTFLIFPIFVLAIKPFFVSENQQLLWLGLFFMAVLPSTVSSSVVMVSIARGNIPAAIFNASISGLIGVALTPLWMSIFMKSVSGDFSVIYLQLFREILLPLVLGLLLRKLIGSFVIRYERWFNLFDKSVILLIIYNSFVSSFRSKVFSGLNPGDLFLLFLLVIIIFTIIFQLIKSFSRGLNFSRKDKITALFCGTKKSLVHGTVFSSVLFKGHPAIGILLMPIMVYHAYQILVISAIAGKYSRQS